MNKLIYLIAGTRPNFMKIGPLIKVIEKEKINYKLVHTGQHYDYEMSKIFFDDLGIPKPDFYLGVGSSTHGIQTAKIMIEFEKILIHEKPKLIIVVGDVNSTLACSLVAKKLNINIAHIEAGLRSFDKRMPEEINRILTDHISDLLFITEKNARKNLLNENIPPNKIYFVGNIMIDTLIKNLKKVEEDNKILNKFGLKEKQYGIITLHRPSNVDNKKDLIEIVKIIDQIQEKIKLIFPMHPRTKENFEKFQLLHKFKKKNILLSKPLGYYDFLGLMTKSKFILSDSGGIQAEASFLKIPLLTLRENSEMLITIEKGTNTLVKRDISFIQRYITQILNDNYKKGTEIEKWDGKTSERIIKIIKKLYY